MSAFDEISIYDFGSHRCALIEAIIQSCCVCDCCRKFQYLSKFLGVRACSRVPGCWCYYEHPDDLARHLQVHMQVYRDQLEGFEVEWIFESELMKKLLYYFA